MVTTRILRHAKYDNLYELSKALIKRDPVRIATELRKFVANAVAEKLRQDGVV